MVEAGPGAGRPRVRFAPSPTGFFHVGSARTALFNWLFARQTGGTFVLRIEDTDAERNREEWVEGIVSAMAWLGLDADEGPFRQSERAPQHAAAVDRLWQAGALYACDCTREQVEERTRGNPTPGYDGYCRDRGLERGPGRALRFRMPDRGVTVVRDVVRGDVEFPNSTVEDFVVVKSSGDPLFVLAVVVDDISMGITHVIRAEEHLPTTPKAVLIWEALNEAAQEVPLPYFAHLPVLVNERRQKISKRRDRVALEDFEALGYLPEAMANYLCLLGWSPPAGGEFFGLDDLVRDFRLEDVNSSPAFFDQVKLTHFNSVYMRELPVAEFTRRVTEWARETEDRLGAACYSGERWEKLAPLVQERARILSEVPGLVEFLFAPGFSMEAASFEKAIARDGLAPAILRETAAGFAAVSSWRAEELRAALERVGERHGRRLGKTQAPVRVATLGRSVGLPLFESLEVLGRHETLERIEVALTACGRDG